MRGGATARVQEGGEIKESQGANTLKKERGTRVRVFSEGKELIKNMIRVFVPLF